MGQTPLALIVLENQGNYTNPIHQRTTPSLPQEPESITRFTFYIFNTQSYLPPERALFSHLHYNISTWLTVELSDLYIFLYT